VQASFVRRRIGRRRFFRDQARRSERPASFSPGLKTNQRELQGLKEITMKTRTFLNTSLVALLAATALATPAEARDFQRTSLRHVRIQLDSVREEPAGDVASRRSSVIGSGMARPDSGTSAGGDDPGLEDPSVYDDRLSFLRVYTISLFRAWPSLAR
jgi:hypothetical protein